MSISLTFIVCDGRINNSVAIKNTKEMYRMREVIKYNITNNTHVMLLGREVPEFYFKYVEETKDLEKLISEFPHLFVKDEDTKTVKIYNRFGVIANIGPGILIVNAFPDMMLETGIAIYLNAFTYTGSEIINTRDLSQEYEMDIASAENRRIERAVLSKEKAFKYKEPDKFKYDYYKNFMEDVLNKKCDDNVIFHTPDTIIFNENNFIEGNYKIVGSLVQYVIDGEPTDYRTMYFQKNIISSDGYGTKVDIYAGSSFIATVKYPAVNLNLRDSYNIDMFLYNTLLDLYEGVYENIIRCLITYYSVQYPMLDVIDYTDNGGKLNDCKYNPKCISIKL